MNRSKPESHRWMRTMVIPGKRGDLIAQATSGQTLNGAQITALLSVIEQIKAGTLSRDSGITIAVSGLGITEDAAKQIIK